MFDPSNKYGKRGQVYEVKIGNDKINNDLSDVQEISIANSSNLISTNKDQS
jgi:hypothetical protein